MEDFTVPDAFTCAFGFKALRLRLPLRALQSKYYHTQRWWPSRNRIQKAVCLNGPMTPAPEEHDAPAPKGIHRRGACGFYAHYTLEDLIKRENPGLTNHADGVVFGAIVVAVMEGWGHVEAHQDPTDGWRSEYARIAAFCEIPKAKRKRGEPGAKKTAALLREIADDLGVPILDTSEAEDYGRSFGVDLSPASPSRT